MLRTETSTALALVKGVCEATTSLITVFSSMHQVRKKEMTELKYRIEQFTKSAYTRYAGELTRTTIEEITKTQRFIDEQNLTGAALGYAMHQLEILNDNLSRVLREYGCA